VFQAESLVVGDLGVARHPEFTAVSVTAEHHVPMRVRLLIVTRVQGMASFGVKQRT
jgi:hypothetical protein